MSRIDDLIAELCPDGVMFSELGEVAEIKRGTSITKAAVSDGSVPVIAGGRTPAYFHNESNRDGETIVIAGSGAYAGYVTWWNMPIFVSDAFSIKVGESVEAKFCYYWLQGMQDRLHELKSGGGVPHVYPRDISPLKMPVPPLKVQREIVKILDAFTELETELEAELEARQKQYQYYRDELLSFDGREDVRWATLGELGQFIRGRRFTKADYVDDGVRCIHYGEIYTHYGISANKVISFVRPEMKATLRFAKQGDVVITDVGETVDDVGKAVAWLGVDDVAIHDHCYAFRHSLNPTFISYCMQTSSFIAVKTKYVARTKVNTLLIDGFSKIHIPVPPLEEQGRIVDILEKFDALVNDISVGLPAEIATRRKQYEYYRDKLLSFKEAA